MVLLATPDSIRGEILLLERMCGSNAVVSLISAFAHSLGTLSELYPTGIRRLTIRFTDPTEEASHSMLHNSEPNYNTTASRRLSTGCHLQVRYQSSSLEVVCIQGAWLYSRRQQPMVEARKARQPFTYPTTRQTASQTLLQTTLLLLVSRSHNKRRGV